MKFNTITFLALFLINAGALAQTSTPSPQAAATLPTLQTVPAVTAVNTDVTDLVGVDFRDIAEFAKARFPEAGATLRAFYKYPQSFLGEGWNDAGERSVKVFVKKFGTNPHYVYGIQLYDAPTGEFGNRTLPVFFMFGRKDNTFVFRKVLVTFAEGKVKQIDAVADIPLEQTHFQLRMGLLQRKLILEDTTFKLKMVYPVGVGGLDTLSIQNQATILTPVVPGGSLEKTWIIPERSDKDYYRGMPFLRISTSNANYSTVGIHIQQNWPTFIRGFDSHGCIRLREKDLMEVFNIMSFGPQNSLALSIVYLIEPTPEHPYPLSENSYKSVTNYGTPERPAVLRDKDDLVVMDVVNAPVPYEQLLPDTDPRTRKINKKFTEDGTGSGPTPSASPRN